LVREGKIKYIGLSTVSSTTLRRAIKIAPVTAVQMDYSVFSRDVEGPLGTNLLSACRELGVAAVVACPLSRGILTSTFSQGQSVGDSTDMRSKMMPRFLDTNKDRNVEVVAKFKAFADRKGCTISQLALAWLLKQGDDIFPIPGTKRLHVMEENWDSLDVRLTDEEEFEIRNFASSNELAGDIVPEQFKSHIYRDTVEAVV
jgi:aryl-alcohol dehydrogenase-like predicted oxidoreductase